MTVTHLSPTATPGRAYSFSPKSVVHEGEFTALSVTATPGRTQSFLPKTPSVVTSNQITALTVSALPGPVRSFSAKTETVIETTQRGGGGSGNVWIADRPETAQYNVLRDDEDLLEILEIVFSLGIL